MKPERKKRASFTKLAKVSNKQTSHPFHYLIDCEMHLTNTKAPFCTGRRIERKQPQTHQPGVLQQLMVLSLQIVHIGKSVLVGGGRAILRPLVAHVAHQLSTKASFNDKRPVDASIDIKFQEAVRFYLFGQLVETHALQDRGQRGHEFDHGRLLALQVLHGLRDDDVAEVVEQLLKRDAFAQFHEYIERRPV